MTPYLILFLLFGQGLLLVKLLMLSKESDKLYAKFKKVNEDLQKANNEIQYFEDIHNTTMIYHLKNALKTAEEREDYESAAYFSNLIGEIESGNAKASFS